MEEIIAPLALSTLLGFIYSQARRRAELALQRRYDLGLRTLERFGEAEALENFLNSPAGRDFYRLVDNRNGPIARQLMRTMQIGLVLGFLGISFILLSVAKDPELILPGAVLTGLGAALLVGTAISTRLVRRWELIDEPKGAAQQESSPYREILE